MPLCYAAARRGIGRGRWGCRYTEGCGRKGEGNEDGYGEVYVQSMFRTLPLRSMIPRCWSLTEDSDVIAEIRPVPQIELAERYPATNSIQCEITFRTSLQAMQLPYAICEVSVPDVIYSFPIFFSP